MPPEGVSARDGDPTRVLTGAAAAPAGGSVDGMNPPQPAPARRTRTEPDDRGTQVRLGPVRRVVSLVPSLTEALACSAPGLLVGATDWCSHPADLDVTRVGGTKNPDVARILGLAPDLVLANEEENRAPDIEALRAAGAAVWVTEVRTVDQALRSLDRMLVTACGLPRPDWLDRAEAAWSDSDAPWAGPGPATAAAVVPIWRRPWMVLGRDTFAGDVLRRLGVRNVYADHADRYPAIPLERLRDAGADLVVLPDEPYRFTATDGPEAFPGLPAALLSGRHLTWYGPSMAEARTVLAAQLRRPGRQPAAGGSAGVDPPVVGRQPSLVVQDVEGERGRRTEVDVVLRVGAALPGEPERGDDPGGDQ